MANENPKVETNNAVNQFTKKIAEVPKAPTTAKGKALQRLLGGFEERLTARIRAMDANELSRLSNAKCVTAGRTLTPLVNSVTGAPISNFPKTIRAIKALDDVEVNRLLEELQQPATGNIASRRSCLMLAVGVVGHMEPTQT
ncbi:hypothetical protein BD410DRAFT_839273 [Rickenella mellea]|uniref:Uncharacterized protein n=1 Tax=Rickenella mellea TaxID=50990 RepID=A0A4Y7Q6K3_9AGAM|nr:hypothetical protein BD410DRAFT_839273 [Rickenella mellea]